jgi:hypothetical protein
MTETAQHFQEEISTVAAAQKYNLTPSYIARLARSCTIQARKFGRDWIIDEEALRDYLAQPRKPGPKPQKKQRNKAANGGTSSIEGNHHAETEE